LAELNALLQDVKNGLDEVAALLRRDAGLTARVIRIANGIVYNQGDPVGSLEEALGRVGYNEVYRVAGMASVAQLANFQLRYYGINAERLRENSLFVALVMEELARLGGLDARTAYTAGLLRSAGKIALDATAQRDLRYVRPPLLGPGGLRAWELEFFGLTNGAVAEAMLRGWRLPYDVYVPIRDHGLQALAVEALKAAKLLNVAAGAAEAAGFGLSGETECWAKPSAALRQEFRIDDETLAGIIKRVSVRFERMRAALA
jgi:HD-like signal output (HDOD) protein